MKIKNFEWLGFFFTKANIDYTDKRVDIGFRYSTGEKNFTDVHIFPPASYTSNEVVVNQKEWLHADSFVL